MDDGQDGSGNPYCLLLGCRLLDPEYVCPAHKARTGRRCGIAGQVDMFDARTKSEGK